MGTKRVIGRRTIQMFWTCRFCGEKNPGLAGKEDESLKCSKCGGQKADESWEMPSDTRAAPSVTDAEQLRYASAGVNWTCAFCHNEERALHDNCSVCGAGRVAHNVKRVASESEPLPSEPPLPVETESPSAASPLATRSVYAPLVPAEYRYTADDEGMDDVRPLMSRLMGVRAMYVIGGTVGIALFIWLCVWLFATHETSASVTDVSWHRVESVKRRDTMSRTGWREDFPAGSFNMNCERRQHGTENCHPHQCNCHSVSYECNCTGGDSYTCNCHSSESCTSNGNGSADCTTTEECDTCTTPRSCSSCDREECDTCYDQCPVYDDWCTGQFYEWVEIDHAEFQAHDLNPRWPGLQSHGPLQRVDQSEEYSTVFSAGDDRHWTFHPSSENEFRAYPLRARYRVEYNHAGHFRPLRRE